MTGRTRALVQRPGRKIHLATLGAGESVWVTLCDRDVPVFGITEHGRDWAAWLTVARSDAPVCARCRSHLLLAGLALTEVEDIRAAAADRDRLAAEVRELRAALSAWTTAALYETRRTVPAWKAAR